LLEGRSGRILRKVPVVRRLASGARKGLSSSAVVDFRLDDSERLVSAVDRSLDQKILTGGFTP